MIVLDTNVVSELFRPGPADAVQSWIDTHRRSEVYLTVTTAAELLYGVARLPAGRRKRALASDVTAILDVEFAQRVLAYDRTAATHFADIVARRRRLGRPMDYPDAQIAAICRARNATLATRNVNDFEGTGIELVNPWDVKASRPRG